LPEFDLETGLRKFNVELKDIKVFSDITGNVVTQDWELSKNGHHEKLGKYRVMKKYQKCLEDDEDDVEAEKVMSDIRNLNNEKFFNIYFNHF
jgi:hypothetical protein